MKSAYELAMERLEQSQPQAKLSEEQKKEIADIDEKFRAKIAEKEVFLEGLLNKAKAEANYMELAELETQRTRELSRLNAECEEAKEKVRQQSS